MMARKAGKVCCLLVMLYAAVWVKLFLEPWTDPVRAFLAFPFVLAALVGMYAAFSVITGVVTFNRSPTALEELKKELKLASVSLQRAGFDFDKFGIPRP